MATQYVIKTITKWKNKNGKDCEMTSYFKELMKLSGVVVAKELGDLKDAKRYETRGGAMIDVRKYFAGRDLVSVEKIEA